MQHEITQSMNSSLNCDLEISSVLSDWKKLDDKDKSLNPFVCLLMHIENFPCYHPYQGFDNENMGLLRRL